MVTDILHGENIENCRIARAYKTVSLVAKWIVHKQ